MTPPVTHPLTSAPRDLTLVIPVWNDAPGLARLLSQVAQLGLFAQVIVVDDGSDIPARAPGHTVLRHTRPQGGGAARNHGLAHVTTSHVMFFDADDLLTPELALLVADLAETTFDMCIFKHADSRIQATQRWGQPAYDDILWEAAGHATSALKQADPLAQTLLAQTANYPWNKIYRTAFLRDHGIACATTQVHQDIPLHWLGFIHAHKVLASDRICAWHHIAHQGRRLSNRSGPERLDVFEALRMVTTAAQTPQWRTALTRFIPGLLDWGRARTDPALHAQWAATERQWLRTHIAPWLPEITCIDPDTAQILRARLP